MVLDRDTGLQCKAAFCLRGGAVSNLNFSHSGADCPAGASQEECRTCALGQGIRDLVPQSWPILFCRPKFSL